MRRAVVVIPVCESLARIARDAGAARTIVLTDPPAFSATPGPGAAALRRQFGLTGTCFMYVGNLEAYQGVDLLLEAFAVAVGRGKDIGLVVVGGKPADVNAFQAVADRRGIAARTRFLGPRPVAEMGSLVAAADVLVSPRIKGVNTPMKIYAYLNSGKPILATDIESHSQVLDGSIAVLEPAAADRFADGICRLADDAGLREELANRAALVAREKFLAGSVRGHRAPVHGPHRVADGRLSQPCSTYQRAVCASPLSFEWRQAVAEHLAHLADVERPVLGVEGDAPAVDWRFDAERPADRLARVREREERRSRHPHDADGPPELGGDGSGDVLERDRFVAPADEHLSAARTRPWPPGSWRRSGRPRAPGDTATGPIPRMGNTGQVAILKTFSSRRSPGP